MDNKIIVISPSYKRHDVCTSHQIFGEDLHYVVREDEFSLYKKVTSNLIVIPSGKVTNIADTRNWILDNVPNENILMVDDDYKSVVWMLKRERKKLNHAEIAQVIETGFHMAHDANIKLWGLNVNSDPMSYTICRPFGFSDMILGPWQGIVKSHLRYDETLPLKEDYDFSLQNLREFKATMRFNYLSYDVDHETLKGGCQTYRNDERELEQNLMLQKKWGSEIVQTNKRHDRDTINMIVKSPI